jgi:WD repeat-containing protein 48
LFSSGLDGRVVRYDITKDAAIGNSQQKVSSRHSIYSLDVMKKSLLICFGTSYNDVNINDLRIKGEQIIKLKEHTDLVRSVKLIDDGKACISAGSDGLLKLWDIGMRQCIKSYNYHTDSIWCLKFWKAKSTVFTGGRDGLVLMTDLIKDVEHKIVKESVPVKSIAIDKRSCSIWYNTTESVKYLVRN